MKYRKLIIAWSVVSLMVAVLLVVLWARSYQTRTYITLRTSSDYVVEIGSNMGSCYAARYPSTHVPRRWSIASFPAGRPNIVAKELFWLPPFLSIQQWGSADHMRLFSTHWFLVLLSASLGMLPWLRWRFSLRTLLIVATLVAVVLGAIAYFAN